MRRSRVALAFLLALGLVLSGCLAPEESDPEPPTGEPQEETEIPEPKVEILEGSIQLSLATPLVSFNYGGEYSALLPSKVENTTGYVIVLVWDAAGPTSESLDLWVRDAADGTVPPEDPTRPLADPPLATAKGESPLFLELAAEEVPDDVEFSVLVRANSEQPVGVAHEQPFTLVIVRLDGNLEMEVAPEEDPGLGFSFV